MNVTKVFGRKVREIRHERCLSQEALAVKAGLHRTYIGAVERGERNITLINAERIARALGVDLIDCLREPE